MQMCPDCGEVFDESEYSGCPNCNYNPEDYYDPEIEKAVDEVIQKQKEKNS